MDLQNVNDIYALNETARPASSMAWKPIETAPNNSDEVLLWDGARRFVGWLHYDGWHDSSRCDPHDGPEMTQPTHWMPLEQPPTTAP